MQFNEYQEAAKRTMNTAGKKPMRLANWAMGLTGEAGEACDFLKKSIFHGHELDKNKLAKELGDVLWYLAALAEENGLNLNEIAEKNVAKLIERYPDGFDTYRSKYRKEFLKGEMESEKT